MIKRGLILYVLICIIFIIFMFSANYIFNVLIKTVNESRKVTISLQEITRNTRFYIEDPKELTIKWKDALFISGWGFLEGMDTADIQHYILLKKGDDIKIFDTTNHAHIGAISYFKDYGLNLEQAGFEARIPKALLKPGEYQIGLYIIKDDERGMAYSNKTIGIDFEFLSTEKHITIDDTTREVKYNLDLINDDDEVLNIIGWGFLEGLDTQDIQHYIVFNKGSEIKLYNTASRLRPGVTKHFSDYGLNLDYAGFEAKIPKEMLGPGEYQIGLYIIKRNESGITFSNHYIGDLISSRMEMPIIDSPKSVWSHIETMEREEGIVLIKGFGFLGGLDTLNIEHYVLLKKGEEVIVFDTTTRIRKDLTEYYRDLGLNLDHAGFAAIIPVDLLDPGEYQIGIYIVQDNNQGLLFFDRYFENR